MSQLQVMMIRRGEMKKAAKLAEYLFRKASADMPNRSYQGNGLACSLIELGSYERGFEILHTGLEELEAMGRKDSPSYVTGLLGLTQGYIDLEKTEDAEKYLARLKTAIELCHSKVSTNTTDQFVKMDTANSGIEMAFYWYNTGRLKHVKGEVDAELALLNALEIMKNPKFQKTVTLFYPEIVLELAQLALTNNDFPTAEKLAQESLKLYETKTVNRGADFIKAKRTLAHARMKLGASVTLELADYLESMKELVYEPHPNIASGHVLLGEAYAKDGDTDKAREHFRQGLAMRKRLLPEKSPRIRQVEDLLAKLPVEESAVAGTI